MKRAWLAACLLTSFLSYCGMCAAQTPAPASGHPELTARLAGLAKSEGRTIGGVRIASYIFLPKLYQALENQLAWTKPEAVAALEQVIRRSWEDGLLPSDFHDKIVAGLANQNVAGAAAADRDIVLSDAFVRLLYQLYFGKVSPNGLDANWNFARAMPSEDPVKLISEAMASGGIAPLIEKTKLTHPLYLALKATLQAFTQYEISGGWPQIPAGSPVKPGASDPRLPLVRQRLAVTGEYQPDSTVQPDILDEKLVAALKTFQRSHGLEAAGTLGPQTVAALNVSVQSRIEQIRTNLERARWILRSVGEDMVVVNIAGYYLRVVLGGKPVWNTRVIVGQTYHKTPIFTEQMKHVVFNPDWTVPRSIVRNEIFPKASANPGYLSANNYMLTSASGPVDPSTLDWSQWTGATFPYGVVQRPGPKNALGLVKFLFPNKHSVYLHDTPGRGLFVKSGRTFSHGCIRVEDPMKLAEVILADRLGWDRAKIDATVAKGKLAQINLPKPLPVLLLYWTVDPQFDGTANFYDDIYGRDARLLKALNSEFKPVNQPKQ